MSLAGLRRAIAETGRISEAALLQSLRAGAGLTAEDRVAISARAAGLVREIRAAGRPGLTEAFLAEFGLSSAEGVALMCLAEALLRVPDTATIDALIEDKIAPSDWGAHVGQSASPFVNASAWALMLTGKVLDEGSGGIAGLLRGAVRRLGEPVIRRAAQRAMQELGSEFVLGETIEAAMARGARDFPGNTFSFDMLGEAARTEDDARRYHLAYSAAITALAGAARGDIRANPGISVKLSALHPRYEAWQRQRVLEELVPRALALAQLARSAGIGFNIDAEEAERLDLSLDVIEAMLSGPELRGWDGFGVVVQAYGLRAGPVISWLHGLAEKRDRRIMVRLVKGAYWDSEIKRAQVLGLPAYPVFTSKPATDIAWIALARRLLAMRGRIYPQFATHNAHAMAAVLGMAGDAAGYEFQRLHGMGAALHEAVQRAHGTRHRIYAPVGSHRDLLAYLVRRLLENGANSSFVAQVTDAAVAPETVAADPFAAPPGRILPLPAALFGARQNSPGSDPGDPLAQEQIDKARDPFRTTRWRTAPILAAPFPPSRLVATHSPADPGDLTGEVAEGDAEAAAIALAAAKPWPARPSERALVLERAADLLLSREGEVHALLAREAGKTLADAESELREAVDFLRFYAGEARRLQPAPLGTFACIAPWNFPLAIFTGQVAAALAAGNAVIAKPAPQTPHIAALAVRGLHEAGVPKSALQFLPGGNTPAARLTGDPRLAGVAFTGSTATARAIRRAMAGTGNPGGVLIAETGGINAMVVDSTALPEQAVRDILASAFRSAGQRCSALRLLCLQEDIAGPFLTMLKGGMAELQGGDPWYRASDYGPLIDAGACDRVAAHVAIARAEGRFLAEGRAPPDGFFHPPVLIALPGPEALGAEVFGPVLHVVTWAEGGLDALIEAINAKGYGLTFGLHTRIDRRVQEVSARVRAGNIYVNRNQIGAVVGSQPFGGEGLSGTGPKAGGPFYVTAFAKTPHRIFEADTGPPVTAQAVQAALNRLPPVAPAQQVETLPGPTGESNRLSLHPRGVALALGPGTKAARDQARRLNAAGCPALAIAPGLVPGEGLDGVLQAQDLETLRGFDLVVLEAAPGTLRPFAQTLARRDGPIVPLLPDLAPWRLMRERHLCVDTTAAGGNAALMAGTAEADDGT